MDERSLKGGNFVFVGGSAGIGRAAAIALGRRGASVLIVARGKKEGDEAIRLVRDAGALSADFLSADLSTVAGVEDAAEGIRAWRPALHGLMHTAMSAFRGKITTADGLEFSFALQYFARAALNRLLVDRLQASGDGRIVHIGGDVPSFVKTDLDDLQFARRKWSFFSAILGTHLLGYLHVQEGARRWSGTPVMLSIVCVGSTKTKAMSDPVMPLVMRLIGVFGAPPERSAANAVRLLSIADARAANGSIFPNPKSYTPKPLALSAADATRLWQITTALARERGLVLPE